MTTESRIQRLEAENRRFKQVALALAMLLVIGLCLAAASAQQEPKPQAVQGDFRILNPAGTPTTVLEQQGDVKVGRDLSVQGKVAIKDGSLVVKGKDILTELDNLKATIVANQAASDKSLKIFRDEIALMVSGINTRLASLEGRPKIEVVTVQYGQYQNRGGEKEFDIPADTKGLAAWAVEADGSGQGFIGAAQISTIAVNYDLRKNRCRVRFGSSYDKGHAVFYVLRVY